ncbi:MAG: hypothetical protein R2779_09280 [Crocinitomicaceae bacterium]
MKGIGWSLKQTWSAPAFTTGNGFTVTVAIAVDEHPCTVVPVTIVSFVVAVGFACGLSQLSHDKAVFGVHR